jgi:ABC-type phosphate transport system substrate-binding protein
MKRITIAKACAASAAATALLASASTASAAVDCSTLTNPVYLAGSTAVKPVLKALAATLGTGASPITLVASSQGSCTGVDAMVNGTKITGTASYWDSTDTEQSCNLATAGQTVDIGLSDVYPTTCNIPLGSGQKDFAGPVQVMNFVVPTASTESSISAEAAYVALGFGGTTYQVTPWTDPNFMFIRPDTSGTKNMIATAIGLVASKWKGTIKQKSGDVLTAVSTSTNPNATFGILASDLADSNRSTVKILAYKHKAQSCGYLPDSTAQAFDKINVREGRYAIWGSVHIIAAVDGSGNPTSANVATVVNYFTGNTLTDAQNQSMIDNDVTAHVVPLCAMKVQRTSEVGAEASFSPAAPCGCYYEHKTGSTSCTTCTTSGNCSGSTPTCRYGYCEAN